MENKPGIKTSEFWLVALGMVIALLSHFGILSPDQAQELTDQGTTVINESWGLFGAVISSGIYAIGRSYVKRG